MRRRDLLSSSALVVAAAPFAGCAQLINAARQVIKDPTVRITDMSLKDVHLDKVTMLFDTSIKNPNPFGISLAGLGYGLTIEGNRLARGDVDKPLTLKAKGTSSMRFPVEVALGKTSSTILSLLQKEEADYKIDTVFKFGFSGGTVDIPTKFEGKFPVPKLPEVSIREFKFTSIGPGGLGIRVNTRVKNINRFDIPVDDFLFNIRLNGRSVLKNEPVSGLRLRRGQTRDVPLDFTVGLVEAGLSVASLVQKPSLAWKVEMKVKSGILSVPFDKSGRIRLV
jgi:LEA14-like dessication related protein